MALHVNGQIFPVRIARVAEGAEIEIHARMGFAYARALIIERSEIVPPAVRTYIHRILAPLS